jgi:hypothetical protein
MTNWEEHLRDLKNAIRRAERNNKTLQNVVAEMDALLAKKKNAKPAKSTAENRIRGNG